MLKILFLQAILGINSIYAQFLEQPPVGNVFVPVNDQVTLSCSVDVGYGIDWEVRINNGEPLNAALRIHEVAFMRHDFTFSGVATSASTLTFGILNETESQTNNETTITCIAQLGVGPREHGNQTQVIFYGTPPPPTDLSVIEDESGVFNISWSLGFIEGVPVNYTLTVLNLNTISAQPIIISGLLNQHYVFETSRPCDVYSFTVTAVTAAGNSTSSREPIFSRNSNDMCLGTTTLVPATDVTTTNGNTGLIVGEIAGIVIAIFLIGIIIIITVVLTCPFVASRGSYTIREVTTTELTARPVGLSECEGPIGLTSTKDEILVLEKKGIRVFNKGLQMIQFIRLEEEHMTEITVDKNTGNIYVTTSQTCKVLKLNTSRVLDASVTLTNIDPAPKFLNGLCINNDKLYVCDSQAHKILIFDLNLTYLKTITGDEKGGKQFDKPRDVEFDQHNNIYIAESTQIQVLCQDFSPERVISKENFNNISALKIVKDSIYAVHDEGVSVFSTSGDFIKSIYENRDLHTWLLGIAVGSNDDVYVSTTRGEVLTL